MCVPLRGGVTGYRSLGCCGDGLGGCDVQVIRERKWLSERDLNARVYACCSLYIKESKWLRTSYLCTRS